MNNLSYKKCKELKDAGFPQGDSICRSDFINEDIPSEEIDIKKPGHWVHRPGLEELIDACGDEFGGLYAWREGKDGKGKVTQWDATVPNPKCVPDCCPDLGGVGKTPIEAVANFYIKLNT